jgi:hypothetical protein
MQTDFHGTVTAFEPTEKGAEIDFTGCGPSDVAQLIGSFFLTTGFKLEKGDAMIGTYGSGSGAVRVLAGGFAGRKKYDVSVTPVGDQTVHASVTSSMSGAGGGLIGVMKEKKQRGRFAEDLKAYLS